MGISYRFECSNCGYSCRTSQGGSRASFQTFSAHPVYCGVCEDVEVTNTVKSQTTCHKCGNTFAIPYGSSKVSASVEVTPKRGKRSDEIYLTVPADRNTCPKCKEFSGKFSAEVFFD